MFVADNGPYLGVYYRRGNSSGTTWSSTKRLNGSMEHAANGALAASGQNVYVAYSVLSGILDGYNPGGSAAARVASTRTTAPNTAWLTPKANFIQTRVDRPAVAAAGAWAYMVFTDADTGEIFVATNLGTNTEDSGWGGSGTVGMTTRLADDADEGYSGMPVIAAIGNKVMVAWISAPGGTIKAVVSPDNGTTWSDEVTLSTAQVWDLAAAGDGTRMALTWANSSAIKLKLYTSSGWQTTRTVATFSSGATYKVGYGPAVALTGNTRVGVAWSACTRSDCSAGSRRVSTCDGANRPTTAPRGNRRLPSRPTPRRARSEFNDYPSVVMTSTPRRYVLYNTASSSTQRTRRSRGRQRNALTSAMRGAPAGVRLDAGRAVRSRPMLERVREMPGGIRLFLLMPSRSSSSSARRCASSSTRPLRRP
jgi:hypothetical protein